MSYRLIVTDIDGTLLSRQGLILPGTRAELARARAAGATLALASGRPLPGLRRLVRDMHLDPSGLVLIGVNGAVVADAASGQVYNRRALEPSITARICTIAQSYPVTTMFCAGDDLIAADPDAERVGMEVKGNEMNFVHLPDMTRVEVPVDKVLLCGPNKVLTELAGVIRAEVGQDTESSFSAPYYFEATAAGVDKGSAVRAYAESVSIPMEQVVAFGDNYNDLPMINAAGMGVAMGNAVEEVRAAADRVTASHDEEGIAEVLADLFGDGSPAERSEELKANTMYEVSFEELLSPGGE
ncbi:Cof-type HAD-IIB family hydrolase [Gephyromycinifex aptenodytis]|uniref:Cof-type HAD-IIB family hydrolase n=1 Tax=Gephyromycinifex aptenodytis TaxID=2716227 RepID=UPI001446BEBD|nr:Cof-type HAD-IIB family hydrolase [Gephyromycinifex aptenodytis]